MLNMAKKGFAVFILLFLAIQLVSGTATVVQVTQPQETAKATSGFFATIWSYLTSPLIWGIFLFLLLFVALAVGMYFLIAWAIKFWKKRSDIFWKVRSERMDLAKVHRRYANSNHWWKVDKNIPVRLVNSNEHGEPMISKPIGYYRGDYQTHEGNFFLWFNLEGRKQYYFFPMSDLLIIPNKEKIDLSQRDEEGKVVRKEEVRLPKAKDIIRFHDNEVLIYAESVSRVGLFLIPVIKSKDGQTIDLSMPTFASMKEVVLGDYLYSINSEFVELSKIAMNINPQIRAINKTADANQNVQIEHSGT